LEALDPPLIATPRFRAGTGLRTYVPNNDLDAVGGDPGRVNEIRAAKAVRPRLFDAAAAFVYGWSVPAGDEAEAFAEVARRLYQLGRGVDMAWARAEVVEGEPEASLARQGGVLHRP